MKLNSSWVEHEEYEAGAGAGAEDQRNTSHTHDIRNLSMITETQYTQHKGSRLIIKERPTTSQSIYQF